VKVVPGAVEVAMAEVVAIVAEAAGVAEDLVEAGAEAAEAEEDDRLFENAKRAFGI